jgi:hypothetical protein
MNAGLRRSCCTAAALLALLTGAPVFSLARIQHAPAVGSRVATLRVLDQAIRLINQPESDFRKILRDAAAALPANADERAGRQLRTFLTRIPTPGPEYKCSDEFVRARALDRLWRLRDVVLDVQTRPIEPVVCYAVPFAVDLDHAQTAGEVVDVYGYDFDATTLQLVVLTRDGFTDVTPSLTVKSHTHATVRIGGDGVPASIKNESTGLAWGHIIHYRVPLVGPTTRLCSTRVETVRAGRVVSYRDIAGGRTPPDVNMESGAGVRLDYSSNVLQAALCVTAADAAASGCISEFLYTADADRVIDAVFGPDGSQISALPRGTVGVRQGLVRRWTANDTGLVAARLDRIRLVSREAESCLSPIAYVEARRTTTFSLATREALDRQLSGVAPAIVGLRPRFAPP